MDHLYLGIDMGNTNSTVFGVTNQGVVEVQATLATLDENAWRKMLTPLAETFTLHAAYEIGPAYDWFHDLLLEFCIEVEAINPADFAIISKSLRKTDKIDARKIAEGLIRGDLPSVYVPDSATRADRRLVAFIHRNSQQLGSCKTKIRSLLFAQRQVCPFTELMCQGAIKWLEETAKPKLHPQEQVFMVMLLDEAKLLVRQRAELDALLPKRLERYPDAKRILTIPGVGPLVALGVLSLIGDIRRFKRPEELSSYIGVCGRVHQSGDALILGAITKRGSVHVRWLLSQVLTHLLRKDAKARRRYLRLKKRGGTGKARTATVRWLTKIIWYMLTRQQDFRIVPVKKDDGPLVPSKKAKTKPASKKSAA